MRLHLLEIQAFQAFAGKEMVDFDALAADGLFLLRGDTGAGKTTVLDAVCFAFYGELPGARAGDARVRSDHAAPDVRTQVVLEATVRGQRVRITRTPAQERPKKVGTGLTVEAATVIVEAVEPHGATRVLATHASEAREELGRLLGLTKAQFCQVVLLPQGEFATFLRARSEDRKELLTELFAAERFGEAEMWLNRRLKEQIALVRDATAAVADVASRLAEATGEEPPGGWEDAPAALMDWLADRRVVAEAQKSTALAERDRLVGVEAQADATLQVALTLDDRRRRHAAAVAARDQLDADRPAHEARVAELSAARRAAVVVPLVRAVAERAEVMRAAVAAAGEGEETALREQAAAARRQAGEAGALAAVEAEVRAQQAALIEAVRELESRRGELTQVAAWLEGARELGAELEATAAAAAHAQAIVEDRGAAAEAAVAKAEAATRRDAAQAQVATCAAARDAARAAALDAQQHWLDLRHARLEGIAAELAGALVDGEPCAVCGAIEHPTPAAPSDAQVSSEAEEAARRHHTAAEKRLGECERALAQAGAQLGAAQALAGEEPAAALHAAAQSLVTEVARLATQAQQADRAAERIEEHTRQCAAREESRATLAQAIAAAEARIASQQEHLATAARHLADALGDVPDVAALVAAHEARAVRLEAAADAIAAAVTATAEHARAVEQLQAEAVAAGFSDAAAAADAIREAAAVTALQDALRAHEDRVAETRAALGDADLVAAAAAQAPDLPGLQQAKRAASERLGEATIQLERAERHHEGLHRLEHDLIGRLSQLAPLREELDTIRDIATLADGTSTQNTKKMRLSAYVLAARLEEIAAAASERLTAMSAGRYTLVHSDEGGRRMKQHGLDLRVIDGWTGRERHPSTLSGGETFLASLALALGLADVVAAEAGGARLETLFVDEGFGSLDEGALDEVLDVLDRLRDGGRCVGVVSHVGELRARITAQLHIVKGRHGSQIRQVATPV